jgi:hypothetical protein
MTSGWLYVLANSYMGGLVKIGRTDRAPNERVDELSAATGVPTPFVLVWHEEVRDSDAAEREVHVLLAQYRVSVGREFFQMDVKDAIQAVCLVASRFSVAATKVTSEENIEGKWARDDELLVAAIQLVQKRKEEHKRLPWERRWNEWPESVDPRIFRMELGMDWEESRRIFQKLQDLGAINAAGTPL